MKEYTEMKEYEPNSSAMLYTGKQKFGSLLNMTSGFPLVINKESIPILCPSSEALYQALKYSHDPDVQRAIFEAKNGYVAKLVHKENMANEDPSVDRAEIMLWVLLLKYEQHPLVKIELEETKAFGDIVEHSKYDQYWGAVKQPNGLYLGRNTLGHLWMEIRDNYDSVKDFKPAYQTKLFNSTINY